MAKVAERAELHLDGPIGVRGRAADRPPGRASSSRSTTERSSGWRASRGTEQVVDQRAHARGAGQRLLAALRGLLGGTCPA